MKICHLYPAVMRNDGPSNVLLALLSELAEHGVENVVVGLRPSPIERNPRDAIERCGGKYIELKMGRSISDVTVAAALIRTLREEKPDILQCNLIRANFYGKLAARIAGRIPVIEVTHNVERYMVDGNAISRLARFAERRTRAMAAAQVAVSHAVVHAQADVLGVGVDEVQMIANGIGPMQITQSRDELRRLLGVPSDAVLVGAVGRLHAQKNYPLLLRAFACASKQNPKLRLIIIGTGEENENLQTLAADLGITRLINWAGHRCDVDQVVSALDIFAMTSDYEGLPIALLEAMRAGIPCVVTRAGGMPEAVVDGETGCVVDCRDLDGLEHVLVALARDSALRNEMGRSAEARFRAYYSAERMAAEYLKLYCQISTHIPFKHILKEGAEENHSC